MVKGTPNNLIQLMLQPRIKNLHSESQIMIANTTQKL